MPAHVTSSSTVTNTISFTVSAGTDRFLLACAGIRGQDDTFTSITFDGDALTDYVTVDGTENGTNRRHTNWRYLVAPEVKTADVVLTISGGNPILSASYFTDVDQAAPLDGVQTEHGISNSVASVLSVPSASGNLIVNSWMGEAGTPTHGAGQTQRTGIASGQRSVYVTTKAAADTSTDVSELNNGGGAVEWVHIAAQMKVPAAGGETVTAESGLYALTGQPAATARSLLMAASPGSIALTGNAAATLHDHALGAVAGNYAYTGQAAATAPGGAPVVLDTGWVIAGAGTSVSGVGSYPWFGASQITADDNAYAQVIQSSPGFSRWLVSGSHGFALPSGATPVGVEARIQAREGNQDQSRIVDIRLVKGGVVQAGNPASPTLPVDLTTTVTDYDFGGEDDLFDVSLTRDDVNSSGFGVAVQVEITSVGIGSATPSVDAIWINVHYVSGDPAVSAVAGQYDLSGQTATTRQTSFVEAMEAGQYDLTGQAADTLWNRLMAAIAGDYAVAGSAAGTARGTSLTPAAGGYAVTGSAAGTLTGQVAQAVAGLYDLVGLAVGLVRSVITMPAGYGSYTLNGNAVTFERANVWAPAAGDDATWQAGDASTGVWTNARDSNNEWS